jgi:hypothetical protein
MTAARADLTLLDSALARRSFGLTLGAGLGRAGSVASVLDATGSDASTLGSVPDPLILRLIFARLLPFPSPFSPLVKGTTVDTCFCGTTTLIVVGREGEGEPPRLRLTTGLDTGSTEG